MRRRSWGLAALLYLIAAGVASLCASADQKSDTKDVPQEVRSLEGTYTGSWTMYGIDDQETVVKRAAWTDTMKAGSPAVQGDRAFVTTTDEMTFEGGKIPPVKVEGKEGYFLKKEGGLGEYFIETAGQVNRMARLGENVWSYVTPASEQELMRLGFPRGVAGQHVLVKVVTKEQGVETHRISRLTTVSWKDRDGKEQALQFVSLQGYHQRQP